MQKSTANREPEKLEPLELVRALSREIATAISAVEKNDLQGLQAAIALQETICHQLVVRKSSFAAAAKDSDLLRQAYLELAQLNRVYAGVIKRSKRGADLLASLYSLYGMGYGKDGSGMPQRQSLTCEV
jgi:hypothetical protein